ncbi:MAG TPA: diacylglycerol kinase family protein [Ktedonobacteraceae bacterium]|nr:diacylglycerol kinase family protein [Ktedonobacteraceae bacterium]
MQEETLSNGSVSTKSPASAIMIANPTSGSYIQYIYQLEEALSFLRYHGWQVELKLTQAAGDAQRLAREAVEQHIDVVIAVGGDGTINEIIQALAGSETALGVLPGGTANVWAREVGIPLDVSGAREVLVHGQRRHIDLGCANKRYFLLMAGIGLDGEVTQAVEKKPLKRLGALAYLLMGAWLGLNYPSFRAFLQVDGRVVKVNSLQIIIGNTQLYGGAVKYTWHAKCDDGLLDICIIRKHDMWNRVLIFLDFILHREQRRQWVYYTTCKSVKLRTRRPIAMQIDGDPVGYTRKGYPPVTFAIAPQALKVIVPQKTPEGLFS